MSILASCDSPLWYRGRGALTENEPSKGYQSLVQVSGVHFFSDLLGWWDGPPTFISIQFPLCHLVLSHEEMRNGLVKYFSRFNILFLELQMPRS